MRKLKRSQIWLFALSGLGPNLMMTLVTAYLNDALIGKVANPAYSFTGTALVSVGLCSVLFLIAKIIDGVIDVPLAYLSDKLKCKFGKRRLSILLGWVPMVISFALLWLVPTMGGGQTTITWVQSILLVIFYSSYTMCLVSYYGCFAHIVENERERVRLSHFKAFFDTVQYCFAYALFPMVIGAIGKGETGGIARTMLVLMPLFVTMLIPMFLIKEEGFAEAVDERVPFLKSIKIAVTSKPFLGWLLVLLALHMGMMLFLTGIGTTIPQNLMGLDSGWKITILNSSAFAPVPLMLLLFNYIKKKKHIRFAFQTALLTFAAAMFMFALSWQEFWGNWLISFLIGITASTIGSFSIGAFFSASYIFPSQVAATEMELYKRDHSAMYFAVQGLVTQVASAVGVNLIYMNLTGSNITMFGKQGGEFFLVPLIAGVMCVVAFFLAFTMKKDYVIKPEDIQS